MGDIFSSGLSQGLQGQKNEGYGRLNSVEPEISSPKHISLKFSTLDISERFALHV